MGKIGKSLLKGASEALAHVENRRSKVKVHKVKVLKKIPIFKTVADIKKT